MLRMLQIFSIFILIGFNIINWIVMFPIIQKEANSHLNSGDTLSLFYFLAAFILIIIVLLQLKRNAKKNVLFILSMYAITLIFWGYIFADIICEHCRYA